MNTTQRAAARLETISLGRLLDHQFSKREDLVTPWLRQGESAMLWAAPGTGKTLLTLTIALMVAGGGEVLGWASAKPRRVLLVDGEMSAEDLQERVSWLMDTIAGIDREAARSNLSILSRNWQGDEVGFPDLGDRVRAEGKSSDQDKVIAIARRHGAELILLDNFSTLVEVADENDAAAMNATLAFLLRLKQARIACVLVHHSGKSGDTYRGSSKLATTFEVILGLKAAEGVSGTSGAAFRMEWEKYRREKCAAVQSRDVTLGKDTNGRPEWKTEATADDDIRGLLAALKTCVHRTQRDLAAALEWDASKVTRTKARAIEGGWIKAEHWKTYLTAGMEAEGGTTSDF